jgi:hypothetical protein
MGSSSANSDSIASNGYIEPQTEFIKREEAPLIIEPSDDFPETAAAVLEWRSEDVGIYLRYFETCANHCIQGISLLPPSRALLQLSANACTDLDESITSTSLSEYLSADRSPSLFGRSTRRSSFSSLDDDDDFKDLWISNIGEQFQETVEPSRPVEERHGHIELIPPDVIPCSQLALHISHPEFHSSSISSDSGGIYQNISSGTLTFSEQKIATSVPQISAAKDFKTTELSLHNTFWKEMKRWPLYDDASFIPDDILRREITVDVIVHNLRQYAKDIPESKIYAVALKAKTKSYKLFAFLCLKKESRHFAEFIREDLTDNDLHFGRSSEDNDDKLYSNCDPNKAIKVLETWTPPRRYSFTRDQWLVQAPIFQDLPELQHQELGNKRTFPFTIDEEFTRYIESGFARVWMVEIHPAHQHLYFDKSGRV